MIKGIAELKLIVNNETKVEMPSKCVITENDEKIQYNEFIVIGRDSFEGLTLHICADPITLGGGALMAFKAFEDLLEELPDDVKELVLDTVGSVSNAGNNTRGT